MFETTPDTSAEIPEADLATFIAKHGKPYDQDTDDYRRPLFAAPVKAGKNTAIYNAHSYHTKVPPQGIVPYIQHYTERGDLVLDPFCGSGMTGVACRMSSRNAVLSDLSPAAVHIARNYCSPVNIGLLREEFDRIRAAVKEEFTWLYGTSCSTCGDPATTLAAIWSDVFECARCGKELVLWEVAVDQDNSEIREEFVCPSCGATWRKTQLRWLRSSPVLLNYGCDCKCCVQWRSENRGRSRKSKECGCPCCRTGRAARDLTAAEKQRIAEIEARSVPYWYPTAAFGEADWEMWRGVHGTQAMTEVARFYTKRNLWALARLRQEFKSVTTPRVVEALMFVFTSALVRSARTTRYMMGKSGNAPVSGTLYVPSLSTENNILELVTRKFDDCMSAFEALEPLTSSAVQTLVSSATSIPECLSGSIDYVFTDPPFGSNIFYADCNLIWEAWLNEGFTEQRQEAVVHIKHKNKNTLADYARLMAESFREMHRVLKPGRWASVVFHNSDSRIWQTILDAAESAGFELAEINAFDKEQLSFKGIRGQKGLERVTNQDIVLNLHKPGPNHVRTPNGTARTEDREARVVRRIAEFLETRPPADQRTLQHLWNQVLYDLIASGSVQVSMADVDAILPHYFKQADGRWYLRGESVVGGRVLDIRNETDALTWLNAVLSEEPQTTGDLIPKWQQVTFQAADAITKTLDQLLAENFWQDPRTGKWRAPNAAEREKMSAQHDIADKARMRQIHRYLDGESDVQPGHVELCGWVQFAYEHKMFEEAVRLFANVHAPDVDEELYRKTRKVAQFCRMQAGKSREDSQLPLL